MIRSSKKLADKMDRNVEILREQDRASRAAEPAPTQGHSQPDASPTAKEIRYVLRKSTDERYARAYPWCVYDFEEHNIVAMGSRDTIEDWTKQLNEVGYVQAS